MITRAGERLAVQGAMTFAEAVRLRDALLRELDRDAMTVDLGAVAEADSAALSLMLEWRRAAKARGWRIHYANLPENLRSLAEVYGVLELIANPDATAASAST